MFTLRTVTLVLAVFVLSAICASSLFAGVPTTLTYQGQLLNAVGVPLNGSYTMQFQIYSAPSGGAALWVEAHVGVVVTNGRFTVKLGETTLFSQNVFGSWPRYLGVTIGADPELAPRQEIRSSPFALRVGSIDGAEAGTLNGYLILNGGMEVGSLYSNGQIYSNYGSGGTAMSGISQADFGVFNTGVQAYAQYGDWNTAVYAFARDGSGSYNSAAVYANSASSQGGLIWAGYFIGWSNFTGNLYAGAKFFKIDDPKDPTQNNLVHACVESNEYKNIYDGTVILDQNGKATVTMPDWFDGLNTEFRYQLTCIGGYAPVYVASKLAGRSFAIAGETAGLEVSWQVTGVRQDAYAKAHPFQVIQGKPEGQRGMYLHPIENGVDESRGIDFAAEKQYEEQRKVEEARLRETRGK